MRIRKNAGKPLTRMNVNILVVLDQNAAVAHAALAQFDRGTGELTANEATGSAKREPGDRRDDTIAVNLAVGRALVNLGCILQDTGRSQVESAMNDREHDRQAKVERVLRGVKTPQETLLPISEIRERYGADAANRAASRREPRGRHTRDGQRG